MTRRSLPWRKRILGGALAAALVLVMLHMTEGFWVRDIAGMTRYEVESLTVREQYDLLEQRFEEMWRITEMSQRAIHEGEWEWLGIGAIVPGSGAPQTMSGTTGRNSYYLKTATAYSPPGGVGSREDLDSFERFVKERGWDYSTGASGDEGYHQHTLRADTGDGWHVWFVVRSNGYYTLDVISGAYWGDRRSVQRERHNRVFESGPTLAVPGVHPEFPSWDAPLKDPSEHSNIRRYAEELRLKELEQQGDSTE